MNTAAPSDHSLLVLIAHATQTGQAAIHDPQIADWLDNAAGAEAAGLTLDACDTHGPLEYATRRYSNARHELAAARDALARVAGDTIREGASQSATAARIGVDRLTLRKWLNQ